MGLSRNDRRQADRRAARRGDLGVANRYWNLPPDQMTVLVLPGKYVSTGDAADVNARNVIAPPAQTRYVVLPTEAHALKICQA